jgi:aminoglycoside phosphotransferase (APT) family kinase protein
MNIVLNLFDEILVKELFKHEVLPLYPDFSDIEKIIIKPWKKLIWTTTYHVVLEFETTFLKNDGSNITVPIYCTAHSSEPRKNVYEGLKYLWAGNFSSGDLNVPRPLFYSEVYNGTFYEGIVGENLYHYIKARQYDEVEKLIPKAAAWFYKLHSLPISSAQNFNQENSRIETVFPGLPHILDKIAGSSPAYLETYRQIYGILIDNEKDYLDKTYDRWLVHGDAHPENIIKMDEDKIAGIDFADLCLADFARDLGTFLQQLDYMCGRKIGDEAFTTKMKDLFLTSYLNLAEHVVLDEQLKARINNYYNWTAMRTATYFLLKSDPSPERAEPLIKIVCENLNIGLNSELLNC